MIRCERPNTISCLSQQRRHTAELWFELAKSELLVDIVLAASLLGPDFEMNARTIRALGILARYRKDASSTIDRDMQIMRESASSVFGHICENLEGVFGKLYSIIRIIRKETYLCPMSQRKISTTEID